MGGGRAHNSKKVIVRPFGKGSDAVKISQDDFQCVDLPADALVIQSLIDDLASATFLSQQLRIIRSYKKIAVPSLHVSSRVTMIRFLLKLSLSSKYHLLHEAFDWIGDFLSSVLLMGDNEAVDKVVQEICFQIAHAAEFSRTESDVPIAACFVSMANLDRSFHWLGDKEGPLGDSSLVLKFLELLGKLFSDCALLITERANDRYIANDSSAGTLVSSTEVLRYTDVCGDCLRALYTILKTRSSTYAPSRLSGRWVAFADSFLKTNFQLLQLSFLHRDIITAIAISSVSLLWLLRFQESFDTVSPRRQLEEILRLLEPSYCIATTATAAFSGYPSLISECVQNALPTISELARCAFLRACLVIFDDDSIEDVAAFCIMPGTGLSKKALWERYFYMREQPSTATASSSQHSFILNGSAFRLVVAACDSSSPEVRFYGVQTLESWLSRFVSLIQKSEFSNASADAVSLMHLEILHLSKLLTKSWSFPSKQVNHMVPSVYKKLMEAASVVYARYFQPGSSQEFWKEFVSDAIELPPMQRGRYQALTMLIPHATSYAILAIRPDLVDVLISSMSLRDIASSVSGLIVAFLNGLQNESSSADGANVEIRQVWDRPVAASLCSPDSKMRTNVADYLVPALLDMDAACATHIMNSVRSLYHEQPTTVRLSWVLWGMINISLQAKLRGLSGARIDDCELMSDSQDSNIADDDEFISANIIFSIRAVGAMSVSEIVTACSFEDADIRLAALSLLVVSQRTSLPLEDLEFRILRATFHQSLKCTSSEQRQKLLRIAKSVMSRQVEASRIALKELGNHTRKLKILQEDLELAKSGIVNLEAVRAIQSKIDEVSSSIQQYSKQSKLADTTACWMAGVLLQGLYPDTVLEKEATVLEVISGVIDTVQASEKQHSCLEYFFTSSYVNALLNTMCSGWDKTRRMAADVLLKFPKPLPSYTTHDAVTSLISRGFRMVGSPRQRESDAGALLVRTIFHIYAGSLGWMGSAASASFSYAFFPTTTQETTIDQPTKNMFASVAFISALCDVLDSRLVALRNLFDDAGRELRSNEQPASADNEDDREKNPDDSSNDDLCHGIVLTIRYCLDEAKRASLFPGSSSCKDRTGTNAEPSICLWKPVVKRLLTLSTRGLETAMIVVAEAPSDVQFAPSPSAKGLEDFSARITATSAVKAPVNTSTYMSATYVNTNSFVGATDADNETGDEMPGDEKTSTFQRAVVAAWLLVKEATALLAFLVDSSPPTATTTTTTVTVSTSNINLLSQGSTNGAENEQKPQRHTELLSFDDICGVGDVILDALSRLKHMGALSESQAALQTIAERLLKHGDRCLDLCRLPSVWLQRLLSRLERGDQVFILRRSAGFAYSIVSLLRAEPANVKATLLPVAATALLGHVESGLVEEKKDKDNLALTASDGSDSGNEKWRSCVHALNVLRVVVIDAALGSDLDEYIARSLELAVRGFSSNKWAVRNSSMMLFSSVIQRAVDNDKNELGGARATTCTDFFTRFPSLFPFLLAELARVTGYTVGFDTRTGQPTSVSRSNSEANREDTCESLFPILLLLAKLRADLSTKSIADAENDEMRAGNADNSGLANLSLFVTLVESCRTQKSQKVREMAAKALAALVPTQSVPSKAFELLSSLATLFTKSRINRNECHGYLCLVYEIIDSMRRRLSGLGSDKELNASIAAAVSRDLMPQYSDLLKAIVGERCPVIHLVFLRVLVSTHALLCIVADDAEIKTAEGLLVRESRVALHPILQPLPQVAGHALLPYAPILYKEALVEFTYFTILSGQGRQQGIAAGERLRLPSEDMIAAAAAEVSALEELLRLLSCPISEVREGVLFGIQKTIATSKILVQRELLLSRLMVLAMRETEPELLTVALETICKLSEELRLSELHFSTRDIFKSKETWDFLAAITSNLFDDDTGKRKLTATITTAVAPAIEIMGWLVQDLLSSPAAASSGDDAVYLDRVSALLLQWVHLLEASSSDESPVECREASAKAILVSSCLSGTWNLSLPSMWTNLVSLWMTTLTLLQDDDDDVRSIASRIVSSRMARTGDARVAEIGLVQDLVLNGVTTYLAEAVVNVVEKSPLQNGDMLSPEVTSVLNRIDDRIGSESTVAAVVCSDGACLTSKIFLEEQANLHIETTTDAVTLGRVLALVASKLLCDGSCSVKSQTIGQRILGALLLRALSGLSILDSSANMSWIGGGTFQKDVFSYVYVTLESGKSALKELADSGYTSVPAAPIGSDGAETVSGIFDSLRTRIAATGHVAERNPWIRTTFSTLSENILKFQM